MTLLNSTSLSFALKSTTPNFDNGTVIVYNSSSDGQLAVREFSRSSFPYYLYNLPIENVGDSVIMHFTFSVGENTDCGEGAIVTSDPELVVVYTNTVDSDADKCTPALAILLTTAIGMVLMN
ncbi:uncharacterized protein LOC142344075 [Convolutriloba macropyga]|uniref:uncharacterized protein LOC142344075 n=1 Tax=Convolutriloba macropyga TaxID=536237 RepID=UPI003F523F1A